MAGPWIEMLQSLPLSRTEREVARRFEQDPDGRTFLPVADILRSHRLHDESLELLTQGVERHPGFTVARVVLARELLQKGHVESSWRALEASPSSLKDNLLAQKLRFKLAVLIGREDVARQTLGLLKSNQTLDAETKRVADALELEGLAPAQARLVAEMSERGVELTLPAAPTGAPGASATPEAAAATAAPGVVGYDLDESLLPFAPVPAAPGASYLKEETLADEEALAAYHVVPLDEIFRPDASNPAQSGAGGVELDTTTVADIYERQGHYGKALAVYRRLLRVTPHSDLLRRKVADLARLEKEQRDVELTVDPSLVDRMETVEIIDRQIRFYNDLLTKLT